MLPYRSNIESIARFAFEPIDETFHERAIASRDSGSFIVAGNNYGQGSSREHAALAPRSLGLWVILAKSFARIHWQNLINFGVVPLTFVDEGDYDRVDRDDLLMIDDVPTGLEGGRILEVCNKKKDYSFKAEHRLSARQLELLIAGGLIGYLMTSSR